MYIFTKNISGKFSYILVYFDSLSFYLAYKYYMNVCIFIKFVICICMLLYGGNMG